MCFQHLFLHLLFLFFLLRRRPPRSTLSSSSAASDVYKRQIQQNAQCLICFDKYPDAVLMECGHGGVCRECAEDIWKKSSECYLCRQKITSILILDLTGGLGNYKPVIKTITQKVEEGSFIEDESIQIDES
eukprot:TRINITY_DN3966_c0_g1_i3.p2 TRINITY_DN3966_c0_g1~~TRINITY_DN3966_c0_g1_i3.p2  ORF type:complete len:131 (+),score=13.63 TRINITY_DN3966_c0_g1_i3:3-395(+)